MGQLVVNKYVIDTPIIDIIKQVKNELFTSKLQHIQNKGDNIRVTCPFHKDGKESHPSCDIYCGESTDVEYGFYRCFTCGEQGPLYKFISKCFDEPGEFGKEWLIERFGNILLKKKKILPPIVLKRDIPKNNYLNESILETFQSYHPYMTTRGLSKPIIEEFKIKYDPKTKCIVFPVWDERGNLLFLTRRSVENKTFYIPEDVDKPIYLLNYIYQKKSPYIAICESQLDALTLWGWGIPAVALFGTGSKNQYDILNKSHIRKYYLFFDGDEGGDKGRQRFIKNMRKDILIITARMPRGKDINDLSKEQFDNLQYY